jgi:peptide deformylase
MVKRILNYNNEEDAKILSTQSIDVVDFKSEELKTLIQDLKDTIELIPDARGISAIQIGVPLRVCLCSWNNQLIIMINPTFTRTRGSQKFSEGCLSVPGVYKDILRYQKV